MSATTQHTGTPPSDVKPTRADALRRIADWLDQHPAAEIDVIALYDDPITADFLAIDGPDQINVMINAIGGEWTRNEVDPASTRLLLEQEISHGVIFRASRPFTLDDLHRGGLA